MSRLQRSQLTRGMNDDDHEGNSDMLHLCEANCVTDDNEEYSDMSSLCERGYDTDDEDADENKIVYAHDEDVEEIKIVDVDDEDMEGIRDFMASECQVNKIKMKRIVTKKNEINQQVIFFAYHDILNFLQHI
eukprot:12640704-Ditylum_brightwellii.AAC.1